MNNAPIISIILILVGSLGLNVYHLIDNNEPITLQHFDNQIIQEGNITYNVTLERYYDVKYYNDGNGLTLKINNPCITVMSSIGESMRPYYENQTLSIFDTCFPKEKLEIGDVIVYWGELDSTIKPHHRIIDIDYEKEWIRTQGDNPETNPLPDDYISFDRVQGKEIGVLNVLEDQKIVKKVIEESVIEPEGLFIVGNSTFITYSYYCVCSSTGTFQFCHHNKTQLLGDTFIQTNDLKEEYCGESE